MCCFTRPLTLRKAGSNRHFSSTVLMGFAGSTPSSNRQSGNMDRSRSSPEGGEYIPSVCFSSWPVHSKLSKLFVVVCCCCCCCLCVHLSCEQKGKVVKLAVKYSRQVSNAEREKLNPQENSGLRIKHLNTSRGAVHKLHIAALCGGPNWLSLSDCIWECLISGTIVVLRETDTKFKYYVHRMSTLLAPCIEYNIMAMIGKMLSRAWMLAW